MIFTIYYLLQQLLCLGYYAALLLGYTIHFIYCIWGNLRMTGSLLRSLQRHIGTAVPLAAIGSNQRGPQGTAVTGQQRRPSLVPAVPLLAAAAAIEPSYGTRGSILPLGPLLPVASYRYTSVTPARYIKCLLPQLQGSRTYFSNRGYMVPEQ